MMLRVGRVADHRYNPANLRKGVPMRPLLIAAIFLDLIPFAGTASDPKPAQEKREAAQKEPRRASLQVGDPAPALSASRWLKGEPVRRFEPGKIYVVEFWATWCGWCIAFMPDAAELQNQYRDKGVTCVFYSARDPDNTKENVAAFIKRRGASLPFTFAHSDDRATYDAWVTAAGREGLPCSFVVDKAGRIAYIGHPMYLGVVLPGVIAGNKPQEVSDEADKVEREFRAVAAAMWPDNKAGLKALKEFEARYPQMANNSVILRPKLSALPRVGELGEAKKVAEAVIVKAIKQGNSASLLQVAALLRNGPGNTSKELLAVAVKAAEAAVQVTDGRDGSALIDLSETYFAAGDKVKAREFARKAVEAAAGESATRRESIERRAKKMDDTKYQ
jgi:thiol-disulfide isomerase/thioredoxin